MKYAPLLLALFAAACTRSETESARKTDVGLSGGVVSGCETRAYSDIGGPIALTAHTGKAVTEADFIGRPSLVYFGFTHCPNVCPTALVTTARAIDLLPEGVKRPQVLLISVDPARDTPEKLATYVTTKVFPKDLTGLTGSEAQVRAAADAFKADYSRIDDAGSMAGYTMDHTDLLYLMDENWQMQSFFTREDTPQAIAACLERLAAPER